METIKDVLCSLNDLDFTDDVGDDDLEKLRLVKQQLVEEFKKYNTPNLLQALNIIDEVFVFNMTDSLDSRLKKTNLLRENIYYLNNFKQFVDTNEH